MKYIKLILTPYYYTIQTCFFRHCLALSFLGSCLAFFTAPYARLNKFFSSPGRKTYLISPIPGLQPLGRIAKASVQSGFSHRIVTANLAALCFVLLLFNFTGTGRADVGSPVSADLSLVQAPDKNNSTRIKLSITAHTDIKSLSLVLEPAPNVSLLTPLPTYRDLWVKEKTRNFSLLFNIKPPGGKIQFTILATAVTGDIIKIHPSLLIRSGDQPAPLVTKKDYRKDRHGNSIIEFRGK